MGAVIAWRTTPDSREDWLKERQKGIGGSDAAAVAGLNPYKSPLEVYLEKTSQSPFSGTASEAAYWGTVLEEVVAQEFSRRTGRKIQRRNAILRSREYPFMLANLDRMIIDSENGPGVLECKTASAYKDKEWEGDHVPDAYLLQVQHYLAVTGYTYAYIACLIGGNRFLYKKIDRDEEIINYLIIIEKDFWAHVEKGIPPEWSGQSSEGNLLAAMYPPEDLSEETTTLTDEIEDLCQAYEEVSRLAAENEAKKKELSNQIKAYMQNYSTGYGERYRVSMKAVQTTRLDTNQIKKDGLYDKYSKISTSKRMTIKGVE